MDVSIPGLAPDIPAKQIFLLVGDVQQGFARLGWRTNFHKFVKARPA